ncbi:MAG: hypothetical protein MRK01_13495 [Candidatus Scalindua sp.]|nr:hypothetical protein [Candidatus Scalindua sp.]
MNILTKRGSCYGVVFALVLVFTLHGCKTASNTVINEPSTLQSASTQASTEKSGIAAKDGGLKEKEEIVTEKSDGEGPEKSNQTQKKSREDLEKYLFNKWSGALGHGGVSGGKPAEEEETEKENADEKVAEAEETKSFPELEKMVVGKWLNEKETESMQYFDDKTIIINNESTKQTIKGTFRFTEKDSLTVDFKEGFLKVPSMSFKITISENELTLIGLTDGVPTIYKRVK